ncbi:MAG: 30S ribosomal protein S1 [Phycisphaerales bacterium]|nr:30S ribosomal protein S1 [Phycisphaerales bacterium]
MKFIIQHLKAETGNASEGKTKKGSATATTKEEPTTVDQFATPFNEFNWGGGKKNTIHYSDKEREKYDKIYEDTFISIKDGEFVEGTVASINKNDVVINIGYKSDGLVHLNEFRGTNLNIGDKIEVIIVEKEDKDGNLHLSRKQAKMQRAWEKIVELSKTGEIVEGLITSKTKGGLIVDLFGMETFLPGSQIDIKSITDYDFYVGKKMDFKVVKINEQIKNAVVSHKALIESDLEAQRSEIIGKLEKGQILEGIVKNITDFGAFMDLGGLDGLLYITDISWGRITHPSDVLKIDQKLRVVVLDFDDSKKRISLGLKQLTQHPWASLPESIKEGSTVKGKVVNIEDYGAFFEIVPGVEGLVHVSEISWSNSMINSREFFKLGDVHEARIVTLDRENKKMSLSMKKLTQDPWETIETKYPVNSKCTGLVKNIVAYGVFVELENGIGGMVHINDLSWLKRIHRPSDFVKVGDTLEVMVLNIDKENRKLQLGHKQVEEDPWIAIEETFKVGTEQEGTIIKKDEKGAIVQLLYGLEAFCPTRFLTKENGKMLELDEVAKFSVIEFDKNEKKIILNHNKTWNLTVATGADEHGHNHHGGAPAHNSAQNNVSATASKAEKSKLGDLNAFASIRTKIDEHSEGEEKKKRK